MNNIKYCICATPTTFSILILLNSVFTFRRTYVFRHMHFCCECICSVSTAEWNNCRRLNHAQRKKQKIRWHKSKIALCFPPEEFYRCSPQCVSVCANKFDCWRTMFDIAFFSVATIAIASSLIQQSIRYRFKCQLETLKHIKVDWVLFLVMATISSDIDRYWWTMIIRNKNSRFYRFSDFTASTNIYRANP